MLFIHCYIFSYNLCQDDLINNRLDYFLWLFPVRQHGTKIGRNQDEVNFILLIFRIYIIFSRVPAAWGCQNRYKECQDTKV